MKKIILYAASVVMLFASCKKDNNTSPFTEVKLSMGANLVYDVFYSFENGMVAQAKRSAWDIAFSVPSQSAAIRINEGSGVRLFTAGPLSDWNNVSVNPTDPTLKLLWNDKSNWQNGAFNRNANPSNSNNFGWGTLDNSSSDIITGDSVYVIRLTNATYKKIMVEKKDIQSNTYYIKWADLNGNNADSASIETGTYSAKQFVYYSLVDKNIVDYEADADTWDLLFTVYKHTVTLSDGATTLDDVTGVLTNQGYQVAKVSNVNPANATPADSQNGFSTNSDVIGSDWKTLNNSSGQYTMVGNLSYFVKTPADKQYQVYFTAFGSDATGNITMMQQ